VVASDSDDPKIRAFDARYISVCSECGTAIDAYGTGLNARFGQGDHLFRFGHPVRDVIKGHHSKRYLPPSEFLKADLHVSNVSIPQNSSETAIVVNSVYLKNSDSFSIRDHFTLFPSP
jgi:hypothetical protein